MGVSAIKWAAAAGLLASAAGLGASAVAGCAAAGAAVGGIIWIGEIASLRQVGNCRMSHCSMASAMSCTRWPAGWLTALGASLATTGSNGPKLGGNGLAFLTAAVACPAVALLGAAARSAGADVSPGLRRLLVYGAPAATVGAVLVAPSLALYAMASPEAASRFVIGFGVNMAGAAVRKALTQSTACAWSGVARNGVAWPTA
ncbi:MAG: hypothetical protein ABWY05_17770 [Noviherbaspirillum sp.]